MPVPTYAGAGAGLALTTGTGTASKTGCTAGNLLLVHVLIRGSTVDYSDGTFVNIQKQAGGAGYSAWVSGNVGGGAASKMDLYIGRATANGTCSVDYTVGASGNDLFIRIYEFAGVFNSGVNVPPVGTSENGVDTEDHGAATSTTLTDAAVTTNGLQRLACNFFALASNQTPGDLTGETGGDWSVVDTFASGVGVLGTLQLQTAPMPTAGTIDGGSVAVSSTDFGNIGLALIPNITMGGPSDDPPMHRLGMSAGW